MGKIFVGNHYVFEYYKYKISQYLVIWVEMGASSKMAGGRGVSCSLALGQSGWWAS